MVSLTQHCNVTNRYLHWADRRQTTSREMGRRQTCKSSNHPLRSKDVLSRSRPSLASVKHTIAVPLLSSHWTAITSAKFTCWRDEENVTKQVQVTQKASLLGLTKEFSLFNNKIPQKNLHRLPSFFLPPPLCLLDDSTMTRKNNNS